MAVVVHFPSPGSELFSNIGWKDVGSLSMVLLEYYGRIWKQESLQKVRGASFVLYLTYSDTEDPSPSLPAQLQHHSMAI